MKRLWLQGLLVFLILLAGFSAAYYLLHTKPKLKRRPPKRHLPMVQVITVKPQEYQVEILEFGTVRPVRTGEIVPEVAGKIFYLSPHLVAGGRFKKGEILVRLDPRDYEAAVALAEGELKEAERLLAEIESEAESSIKEWRDILQKKEPPPPLVAKVPQLAAARARVEAARAKLRKAKLDLERTIIRAPFDGLVVEENVDLGQYVSPGVVLAKVYDAQAVEVSLPLDLREIKWLKIPGFNAQEGSWAEIFLPEMSASWSGRISRASSRADEKTRLLEVFLRVERPFSTKPPLLPGFFVRARLKGKILKGVYVLPREALRREEEGFKLYLVDRENRLQERKINVIFLSPYEAVIDKGLSPGDQVVISRLVAPVSGMKVRPQKVSLGTKAK